MGEANRATVVCPAMASTLVEDGRVEQFEAALRGELVRPHDADYDEARAVWNGVIDSYPALIARCRGVADVQRAQRRRDGGP